MINMTQQDKELLEQNGFDIKGAMKRFLNNEALYKQCLDKFLTDQSFHNLKQALSLNDCQKAFHEAHTMKGFVSNLGMQELYEAVSVIVEKLRAGDMNVAVQMQLLEELYEKDYQLIRNL